MSYYRDMFRKLESDVRQSTEQLEKAVLELENASRMKRENAEKLQKYAADQHMIYELLNEQLVGNFSMRYLVTQGRGPEFAVVHGTTAWIVIYDEREGRFVAACGDVVNQRSSDYLRNPNDPGDEYAQDGKHFIDTMKLLVRSGMKRLVACCPEGYLCALREAMEYSHEQIPVGMHEVECCIPKMLPRAEQIPPNRDRNMFETCEQVVDDGRAKSYIMP